MEIQMSPDVSGWLKKKKGLKGLLRKYQQAHFIYILDISAHHLRWIPHPKSHHQYLWFWV